MLAVGYGLFGDLLLVIAVITGSLLQARSGSPLTGAVGIGSEGRLSSTLAAASDEPFLTFSALLVCCRLPAELALVGSSVPDVA